MTCPVRNLWSDHPVRLLSGTALLHFPFSSTVQTTDITEKNIFNQHLRPGGGDRVLCTSDQIIVQSIQIGTQFLKGEDKRKKGGKKSNNSPSHYPVTCEAITYVGHIFFCWFWEFGHHWLRLIQIDIFMNSLFLCYCKQQYNVLPCIFAWI